MVAQFLRLKLTLLANTLQRPPRQLVGILFALLCALALVVILAAGLISLRGGTAEISHAVTVVLGTTIVLGFLLAPLAFGVDDPMDPRRFSLFGITTARLAVGLLIAGLASVPTASVAVLALAQVATWSRSPGLVLLSMVSGVVIVATCAMCARVSTTIATLFLHSRRSREATGAVLVLVPAAIAPLIGVLATADWESVGLPVMRRIGAIAEWTPLGAAWSVPGAAAMGDGGTAASQFAIAVAFLGVLCLVWRWLVELAVATQGTETRAKRFGGLGWFAHLPANSTGAVAARSLSYWSRDARYRVALVVVPVVPIVMVLALVVGGAPWLVIAWIPVPVMCLFLAWITHNDLAHDGSAYWTHVSSNTSGAADRWGRLAPPLMIGIPLALVGSVVTVMLSGAWQTLPALVGLSMSVLLGGLGVSSVISVAFPYPAVHPGDSPFAQPQAQGNSGERVQAFAFVSTVLLAVPSTLLIVRATQSADPQWYWAALAAGLGLGLLVLVAGVLIGARLMSRRAPELLDFTLRN